MYGIVINGFVINGFVGVVELVPLRGAGRGGGAVEGQHRCAAV